MRNIKRDIEIEKLKCDILEKKIKLAREKNNEEVYVYRSEIRSNIIYNILAGCAISLLGMLLM